MRKLALLLLVSLFGTILWLSATPAQLGAG